jgi:hypothetical protein
MADSVPPFRVSDRRGGAAFARATRHAAISELDDARRTAACDCQELTPRSALKPDYGRTTSSSTSARLA